MDRFRHLRSKSLSLLLLLSLAGLVDFSSAEFPQPWCSPIRSNHTLEFTNNIRIVYSILSSNTSASLDAYASVGKYPDKVYAQFMCQPNVKNCSECVSEAYKNHRSFCPDSDEAIIWQETCLFRYSIRDFAGRLDISQNRPFGNKKDWPNLDYFGNFVVEGINNLINETAHKNPMSRQGNETIQLPGKDILSAQAQCTSDLSSDQCVTCLQVGFQNITQNFKTAKGARVISFSCFLRYELYPSNANVNVTGNLFPQDPLGDNSKSRLYVKVIAALGGFLLLIGVIVCAVTRKNKKRIYGIGWSIKSKHSPLMEMSSILKATDNFSKNNFIGMGYFGSVYKGVLRDGREVAVKKLSYHSQLLLDQFANEVKLLMKLQHKNVVRLLGFCVFGWERCLVYEYLCNGSLDTVISDPERRKNLSWRKRMEIIEGVACGMLYLHEDSRPKAIHRDLKCSNVLLDQGMNPKISDFGIAKIFEDNNTNLVTSIVVGTIGYMAPEYAMEGRWSVKSDVYSFGVVLLEIITGRMNVVTQKAQLIDIVWGLWNDGDIRELMDSVFTGQSCPFEEFSRYLQIGLLCVQQEQDDRPTMSEVIKMLNNVTAPLRDPNNPPCTTSEVLFINRPQGWSNNNFTLSEVLPR